MAIVSGDGQSGAAGQELPQPIVVRVTDADGRPIAGADIEFRVTAGGGQARGVSALTDADGRGSARWVLGTVAAQPQQLRAGVVGAGGIPVAATATATATPGAAAQLVALGGDGQAGALGEALPESLAVRAADPFGNGVAGVPIAWTASDGAGTVAAGAAVTGADGVVRAA
jgi:hypothetical protein